MRSIYNYGMTTDSINKTTLERFWKYSGKAGEDECWKWTGTKNRGGYGVIGIQWMPKQKVVSAHRLSYIIANGEIPDGLSILHSCDCITCVNPKHLRAGTQLENMRDRSSRGRCNAQAGERHHKAKLSAEDVIAIRASTGRQVDIAARYGIAQNAVSNIKLRKIWKCVPDNPPPA